MSEQNPWKTVSSRIAYRNPWIRVREDQVIRPDGTPGLYGVVETKVATGVVAIDDRMDVTLVGQFRYAVGEYSWEIVKGAANDDETPLEGIRRELREEVGLVATDWTLLGPPIHLTNSHSSEVAHLFLARGLSRTRSEPDGTEVLQVRTAPLSVCVERALDGDMKDAMTIMALFRASALLAPGQRVSRR